MTKTGEVFRSRDFCPLGYAKDHAPSVKCTTTSAALRQLTGLCGQARAVQGCMPPHLSDTCAGCSESISVKCHRNSGVVSLSNTSPPTTDSSVDDGDEELYRPFSARSDFCDCLIRQMPIFPSNCEPLKCFGQSFAAMGFTKNSAMKAGLSI